MRYKKFSIKNYKGIKSATIDLTSMTGANVFTLVGLNESGKTTILEAIHSFAPDYRSGTITKLNNREESVLAQSRVPRHQIASFTGEIIVEAIISVDQIDKIGISNFASTEYDIDIEANEIPDVLTISRSDHFKRGDYVRTTHDIGFSPDVKILGQRKARKANDETIEKIRSSIREFLPDIAYYSTLIFDFPERIYLTLRPGNWSSFYHQVFQDILAVDGQGYTIDDITRRVRSEKFKIPWLSFFADWMKGDDREKIQQIIDRASSAVTGMVFGKWNEIFGENAKGKEIIIGFDVEEGRTYNRDQKSYEPTEKHDIYVWFEIKDGTRRFKVNDRSLGFRWFFAFLLFTQFRVARQASRNVLFLFDEPAANLHAAAQQKLIESFPEIAKGDNMLIYSTHSHYMIDPCWLEQTFIVTNRAESPSDSIVGAAILDDESLDIKAHRYREFANAHPNETSYFQPIVDRLDIVPSKFDYNLPSVVVEGKSDYYIINYAMRLLNLEAIRLLPASGSGTFGALISLSAGWGIKFLFLLDGDEAGKKERERYALDLGAPVGALSCIDEHIGNAKEIESLLDADARKIIGQELNLNSHPNKKQIMRFFQESLAKGKFVSLGSSFDSNARMLIESLRDRLAAL